MYLPMAVDYRLYIVVSCATDGSEKLLPNQRATVQLEDAIASASHASRVGTTKVPDSQIATVGL